ncbi:MAG: hypothetical protein GY834_12830 [Bacteroidetes bacterium]|nr:hypothetical protein [Bacteroidota bacterium]
MDSWEKMLEQQRKMQEQFQKLLPDTSYMKPIQRNFEVIEKIIHPHRDLIEHFSKFDHLVQSPALAQIEQLNNAIQQSLPQYSHIFLLSSSVFEAYRYANISIPDTLVDLAQINTPLIDSTNLLSSELERLNDEYLNAPIIFDNIPNMLIAPVISGSAHFQVLKNLNYIDVEINEESEEEYLEIVDESCSIADAKIEEMNSDWSILLHGAEQSFASRNPDKVRHTITSLRELITQILHVCAPDDDIKETYPDAKYYDKGKPTRRTRIRYILSRKYSNTSLAEIIEKDIAAILELFKLYQAGTHKVISSLNDDELLFILKRTKLLIEQLI